MRRIAAPAFFYSIMQTCCECNIPPPRCRTPTCPRNKSLLRPAVRLRAGPCSATVRSKLWVPERAMRFMVISFVLYWFCYIGSGIRTPACESTLPLFGKPRPWRSLCSDNAPYKKIVASVMTLATIWCARLDSNQRPSGSEFPDTQRKTTISSRFSSVVHKVENHIKSPRSLFGTGFAGFCMRGGQIVVTVVNLAWKISAQG